MEVVCFSIKCTCTCISSSKACICTFSFKAHGKVMRKRGDVGSLRGPIFLGVSASLKCTMLPRQSDEPPSPSPAFPSQRPSD